MRAFWLLALFFAAPAAAQLTVYGLTPPEIAVVCAGKPCPEEERARVLAALTGSVRRMPKLLAGVRPSKLTWESLPEGSPADGNTESNGAGTLYAPAGKDMTAILAHELSHVLEASDPKTVAAFLALRHDTPAYQEALGGFWAEVWRSRGPEDDADRPLSPRARALMSELRLPRRHTDDLHAAKSRREYWAVSVELAFLAKEDGKWERLDAFMTPPEAAYLRSRF
ncbi:MAG: hypothetical protein HYV15_06160 [Elusimicrobia bacterium]|nr:hypothetical protein [Elusimicrobiota bacterium]